MIVHFGLGKIFGTWMKLTYWFFFGIGRRIGGVRSEGSKVGKGADATQRWRAVRRDAGEPRLGRAGMRLSCQMEWEKTTEKIVKMEKRQCIHV